MDYDQLELTRQYQSDYVKRKTEFGKYSDAISACNLENLKWLKENDKAQEEDLYDYFDINSDMAWLCLLRFNVGLGNAVAVIAEKELQFKYESVNELLLKKAVETKDMKIIEWVVSNFDHQRNNYAFESLAVILGNLEILKFVFKTGFLCSSGLFEMCARTGNLEIAKWLNEEHFDVEEDANPEILDIAAEKSHFEFMKWCVEKGFNPNEKIFALTAENDNLEILEWLDTINCPMDLTACKSAARKGNLDVLNWLYVKECEINSEVYSEAVLYGKFDVILFFDNIKCSIPKDILNFAFRNGDKQIIQFLLEKKKFKVTNETVYQTVYSKKTENIKWVFDLGKELNPDFSHISRTCSYEMFQEIKKLFPYNKDLSYSPSVIEIF